MVIHTYFIITILKFLWKLCLYKTLYSGLVYILCYVDIQRWIPCDRDYPNVVYKELTDLPSDKVSFK